MLSKIACPCEVFFSNEGSWRYEVLLFMEVGVVCVGDKVLGDHSLVGVEITLLGAEACIAC